MKKPPAKKTTVTVYQASSVELTKRGSSNSLKLEVRSDTELLGTLLMGLGSVQWWPNGNRKTALKRSWKQFVKLLETEMAK